MGSEALPIATRPHPSAFAADVRPLPALQEVEARLAGTPASVLSPERVVRSPRDVRALRGLRIADAASATLALAVAVTLTGRVPEAVVLAIGLVVAMRSTGALRSRMVLHPGVLDELPELVRRSVLAAAFALVAVPDAERAPILAGLVTALVLAPGFRGVARRVARRATRERVLVVGSGVIAGLVATKVVNHPELGVDVVGCLDVGAADDGEREDPGLPRLGTLLELEQVVREHDVHRVVIAFSAAPHESILDAIRRCKRLDLKVAVVPRLFEVIGGRAEVDELEGLTMLALRPVTRSRGALARKRAMDVVVASAGLALLAPVILLAALVVRLGSPGPVLFRQPRVGRHQRTFDILKLRTMTVDAEARKSALAHRNEMAGGPMFKLRDDPRIVPGGGFLRRTSLDELPQLWNVLRGEMSLVGPRPLVPDEDQAILGWHRARLDITPGLTGPWQVLGRNAIPFDEMVKLDYLYVADWSLWLDCKLVLRTIPVVLGRRGA